MTAVRCNDVDIEIEAGVPFCFGRAPGPGQLVADDRRVSNTHGELVAHEDGWTLTCRARYTGLTVYDCDSPSRLMLPAGAGPVRMPFAHAIVAIELKAVRYHIEVMSIGASGWSSGWATALAQHSDGQEDPAATVRPHYDVRFFDRRGRPLRWYQTLVALCEPRLQQPPQERIPSNRELAHRLGVSQGMVENHYLDRLRRELGFAKFDDQSRLAAVIIALSQAMVTRSSLYALDLPGHEEPG